MKSDENKDQRLSTRFRQQARIETQIHRRRKVKAFSPLELEWESSLAGPSSGGMDDEESKSDRALGA